MAGVGVRMGMGACGIKEASSVSYPDLHPDLRFGGTQLISPMPWLRPRSPPLHPSCYFFFKTLLTPTFPASSFASFLLPVGTASSVTWLTRVLELLLAPPLLSQLLHLRLDAEVPGLGHALRLFVWLWWWIGCFPEPWPFLSPRLGRHTGV